MAHRYISLGSACDAATMIRKAGLRRASYPFDWLLNVQDGLGAIVQIIRRDFEEVTNPDSYFATFHKGAARVVPAYKAYPRTFHLHSDPVTNPDHHEDLVRRFERMRDALRSTDHLHFLYYRDYPSFKEFNPCTKVDELVRIMHDEILEFLKLADALHAGRTTILAVVSCFVEDEQETATAINSFVPSDARIKFGNTLVRYDDAPLLNAKWERQWIDLLISRTQMPKWMIVYCRLKQANRRLRAIYSRKR